MRQRQSGFILAVIPILLVGLLSLGLLAIHQSKTAMRIAGSDLDQVQSKLCLQQCASLAVNAAVLNMEDGAGLTRSSHTCPCGDQVKDRMECEFTYSTPQEVSRVGCYDLLLQENQVSVDIKCKDSKDGTVNLEEDVTLNEVPIFQFSIFSNGVLQLHPGADMDVPGRVHSNDSIQLSPLNELKLGGWMTTPVGAYGFRRMNSQIRFAKKQGIGFSSPVIPDPTALRPLETLIPDWSNWLNLHRVAFGKYTNGCFGAQPLRLPIRGIHDPHSLIEWRQVGDNQSLRRQMFSYKASLIRHQDRWKDGDLKTLSPTSDPVRPPPGATPGNPGRVRFWDARDELMLQLIPIDVAVLQAGFGRSDSVIYLHDEYRDPSQGNRVAGGYLLWNAARLTRPLTIATNTRMVLLGDFNIVQDYRVDGAPHAYPAALISDVMLHLSSEWVWTEHDSKGESAVLPVLQRNPGARMTLNACIMSGLLEDNTGSKNISGGIHNMVRYQEEMDYHGRRVLHSLNGSIVSMWTSRHSNQFYSAGAPYFPPARSYAFDPMYQSMKHMPPGTPVVVGPHLNSWELVRK